MNQSTFYPTRRWFIPSSGSDNSSCHDEPCFEDARFRMVRFSSAREFLHHDQDYESRVEDTWYCQQDYDDFEQDFKALAREYKSLMQCEGFDQVNLAGVQDLTVMNGKSSRRKLHVQSVLFQQDLHRALQIKDAEALASVSFSFSKASSTQAIIRATPSVVVDNEPTEVASWYNKQNCDLVVPQNFTFQNHMPETVILSAPNNEGEIEAASPSEKGSDCCTAAGKPQAVVPNPSLPPLGKPRNHHVTARSESERAAIMQIF